MNNVGNDAEKEYSSNHSFKGDMSDVGNGKAYNERRPDQINPPESPFF